MEDFDFISNYINKMHWPKKPKVIFTSHFMQKTFQSRYVAECIEKNDTVTTLEEKIHKLEYEYYPKVIQSLLIK